MKEKTKRSILWVKKTKKQKYAGIHLIAEFWGGKNIEQEEELKELLLEATKKAKSTPLKIAIHSFSPQGITGVVLLAESHIALHSWPEVNYLAIDIFTCGDESRPYQALEYFKEEIKPKRVELKEIKRGKMVK